MSFGNQYTNYYNLDNGLGSITRAAAVYCIVPTVVGLFNLQSFYYTAGIASLLFVMTCVVTTLGPGTDDARTHFMKYRGPAFTASLLKTDMPADETR